MITTGPKGWDAKVHELAESTHHLIAAYSKGRGAVVFGAAVPAVGSVGGGVRYSQADHAHGAPGITALLAKRRAGSQLQAKSHAAELQLYKKIGVFESTGQYTTHTATRTRHPLQLPCRWCGEGGRRRW